MTAKIKILLILSLTATSFLCSTTYAQTAVDILNEASKKFSSLSNYNISYSGTVYMPSMNPDTLYSNGNIYAVKNNNDTIVGYNYYIEMARTDFGKGFTYYNGEVSHYSSPSKGYSKTKSPEEKHFSRSVFSSATIDMYYMVQNLYIRNLLKKDDGINLSLLADTTINEEPVYHLRGVLTGRMMTFDFYLGSITCKTVNELIVNEDKDEIVDLFISKTDYLPMMFTYRRFVNNEIEMYSRRKIGEYKTNSTSNLIIPDEVKFTNSIEPVNQKSAKRTSNSKAPSFCTLSTDSIPFCIDSVKTDKILLVFSSENCAACVKQLEPLNNFYNTHNNNELTTVYVSLFPDVSKMKAYKLKNELDFELYMGSSEIWKGYKISGFPTFYLLDKKRNQEEFHLGFLSKAKLEAFTVGERDLN